MPVYVTFYIFVYTATLAVKVHKLLAISFFIPNFVSEHSTATDSSGVPVGGGEGVGSFFTRGRAWVLRSSKEASEITHLSFREESMWGYRREGAAVTILQVLICQMIRFVTLRIAQHRSLGGGDAFDQLCCDSLTRKSTVKHRRRQM